MLMVPDQTRLDLTRLLLLLMVSLCPKLKIEPNWGELSRRRSDRARQARELGAERSERKAAREIEVKKLTRKLSKLSQEPPIAMSNTLQDKRPLGCICAPCDCGVHNCANYEALAARRKNTRNRDQDDRHLRQFRQLKAESPADEQQQEEAADRQPIGRSRAKAPNASTVDRKLEASQAGIARTASVAMESQDEQECRCLGGNERYLASQSGAPTKFKSADELKATLDSNQQHEQPDSELLHVLVTRPEIASKSRDNILFEADMDLKTTFETIYEALAKMRLDHWRRFQEQQEQREQPATAKRPSSLGKPRATEAGKQGVSVAKGPTPSRRAKRAAAPGTMTTTTTTKGAPGADKVWADESLPLAAGKPSEAAGKRAAAGGKQVAAVKRAAHDFGTTDDAPSAPTPAAARQRQQRDRRAREEFVVAQNIDPDLSPIIVYDANMNRLETMGLRRRSKYRPSTNLHTGARGMFGDQELETDRQPVVAAAPPSALKLSAATTRQQQQAAHQSPTTIEQPETPTHSLQRKMEMSESPFRNPELSREMEFGLNARNLKDTNQGNYLCFSEYNLPVGSKRKSRDNVNMHDHIKEQNIIENSNWTELPRDMGLLDGFSGDEPNSPENLALIAQQEEANSVEEIQRCTGG